MATERLAKFIARCGVASRRKSEEIVRSGRVKVNRAVVTDPAHAVDAASDVVWLDNDAVSPASKRRYIALYKPVGYLSDLADTEGRDRPLARSLISLTGALFPVGRLDYTSEGLMIFTDDGEFANHIMHPRYKVEKEYHVKLSGSLTSEEIGRATSGLMVEGQRYRVKAIAPIRSAAERNTWYRITATEGKYRHIRRLAEGLAHHVLRLRRVRIGPVRVSGLKPGEWRFLEPDEVRRLVPGFAHARSTAVRRT
jgi:23S rRNA pseudouridine2605 synthase